MKRGMKILELSNRLKKAKAGRRYNEKQPMVHPALLPEDRDLIVAGLERLIEEIVPPRSGEQPLSAWLKEEME